MGTDFEAYRARFWERVYASVPLFETYKAAFWKRIPRSSGRRPLGVKKLEGWQRWRRNRERRLGVPDPVLVSLGLSVFRQGENDDHDF